MSADNATPIREHTVELDEAARYLGIARSTLCKRARAGDVPAYKPGRRWVFLPSELEKYLRSSAPPPSPQLPVALFRSQPQEDPLAREIHRKLLALGRERRGP